MRREEFNLDNRFGEEYVGHYVFQEITWAKRSHIIQKHTKYSEQTGRVINLDSFAIQAETVLASLREQPQSKPISFEKLLSEDQGIPIELGELFSKIVNKLNGMTHEDLRFLLEQLDEESRAQLLQSLGYVKSSVGHLINSPGSLPEQSTNSLSSSTS
jgi:hypothetical protein